MIAYFSWLFMRIRNPFDRHVLSELQKQLKTPWLQNRRPCEEERSIRVGVILERHYPRMLHLVRYSLAVCTACARIPAHANFAASA